MNTVNTSVVHKLESTTKSVYNQGVSILIKLLDNIITSPDDPKFRSIRLENKKIKEELLSVDGMKELLAEIGFQEGPDGKMTLPPNVLLAKLKRYRVYIKERQDTLSATSSKIVRNVEITTSKQSLEKPKEVNYSREIMVEKLFAERIRFPKILTTNSGFLNSLESMSDCVMQYEDPVLQNSARRIVPIETLKEKALENLRKVQKQILSGKYKDAEPHLDILVLMELTRWFKESFFRWINKMPCKVCGNEDTKLLKSETKYGVLLEVYKCPKPGCQHATTEFYRYNDVAKLLTTRAGRCGEWANCFTFLCRCLGYEARHVYSTSDHVWTEVYVATEKRWLHIDPCENVFDSPLMYEHGWKRNVSYVMAFSKDDVQDVTPRYSNQVDKVLQSRNHCTERELLQTVIQLRQKRQAICTSVRKAYLRKRTLAELVDFFRHRQPTEGELKGRSSGSLAWRLERGEEQINNFYIFNLTDSEIAEKEFNIRYSCTKNQYERYSKANGVEQSISKWETLHFSSESLFRKVEQDWKMAYLARQEGSTSAFIIWKFDFSATKLKIKSVNMKLETKTYENGTITVKYLDANDKLLDSLNDLRGLNKFSLRIDLFGGKGDIQWQHTQLFRQSLDSNEFPFDLSIQFL